ncbi:MAG: VanZ family protein [Acidobacteriota bacterium]
MAMIFWFSTDRFSSAATGSRFELIIGWLAPWIEEASRMRLHHLVRKLGHLTEYGLLAVLWMRALESYDWGGGLNRWRARALVVMLIVSAYALFDEWRQTLTATRSGSLIDCGIDTAGGVIGLLLRRRLLYFTRATRRKSIDLD